MANIFSRIGRLFGIGKKEDTKVQTPQAAFGPRSIFEGELGKDLLARIQARARGEGVGISPELLASSTAPFAATRRAGVKEVIAPAINARASAAGLGRSTIPTAQIGQAGTEAERDIATEIANREIRNEEMKQSGIETAIANLKQLLGLETGVQQGFASNMMSDVLRSQTAADEARKKQEEGLKRGILTAGGFVTGGMAGPAGAAAGALSGFSGSSGGAGVKIAGQELDMDDVLKLLTLLGVK